MKKMTVILMALLLVIVSCFAAAQTGEVRLELNAENFGKIQQDAGYATLGGKNVNLRTVTVLEDGTVSMARTGNWLKHGTPLNIWGIPVEAEAAEAATQTDVQTELAVAIFEYEGSEYVFVTSKLGDGAVPAAFVQFEDWDKEAFDQIFADTPDGEHGEEPTPLTPATDPSMSPSVDPSGPPTYTPSEDPSWAPSYAPSEDPSWAPSYAPTEDPSWAPSHAPTEDPSWAPSHAPTEDPSWAPSYAPTEDPSWAPSVAPSWAPSYFPF